MSSRRNQGWRGFQGMNFVSESGKGDDLSSSQPYDPPPTKRPGTGPYSNPLALPPQQQHQPAVRSSVAVSGSGGYLGIGKRRYRDEDDEYFNDDDEPKYQEDLEYIPAPDSPSAQLGRRERFSESTTSTSKAKTAIVQEDDDDSDDPLDKYMANVEEEVKKLDKVESKKDKTEKGVRDDIEGEDEMEAYMRFMEENPHVGCLADEDEQYEYDADGNIIGTEKKTIDPLPQVDHSEIAYQPFEKNFFQEPEDIAALSWDQVQELRQKLGVRVTGIQAPKPVCSFAHFGFDEKLISAIRKAGFTQPTPIQAQGVPVVLSGRDLIGIAKTGSGKTAAYLWPLIVHIMDQPELRPGDGPIGLICAPTRELSQQIYTEARKIAKVYNIAVVCAYGGGSLWEQQKACEAGCEILVCTPGRLIDLVKKKATNLQRVTYLVFDEADKMFNLGFEPQVRSIANHVRPDRQTMLFSATFKKKVEKLARDILCDPIRIVQGELGEANEDITQIVEIFDQPDKKLPWLFTRLVHCASVGSVLIFVTKKINCMDVADKVKQRDIASVGVIHGDMHQTERNSVIQAFKKQETKILVATDVAARGLDIPSVRTVINYDVARDIDTHTHRIGRTGRAGQRGTAYTLLCTTVSTDKEFSPLLVRNLEAANQWVPPTLLDLAMLNPWFKKTRFSASQGKGMSSKSFAARQRPGLGSSESSSSSRPQTSNLQTNRYSSMKTAFQAQYNRMFVSAGVANDHYIHPELLGQASSSDNNSGGQVASNPKTKTTEEGNASRRKRTRWD